MNTKKRQITTNLPEDYIESLDFIVKYYRLRYRNDALMMLIKKEVERIHELELQQDRNNNRTSR